MREFSFNIPFTGLKRSDTDTNGLLRAQNLQVNEDGWSVPKRYDQRWSKDCQLVHGSSYTLLWSEEEWGGWIPIRTIDDLQKIGNVADFPANGNYILTQDIDASITENWNDGAGWKPIPTFYGTFDGQGHSINDIWINRPNDDIGLFRLNAGTITNLSVAATVHGSRSVGCLCGRNTQAIVGDTVYTGMITNCSATGNVSAGSGIAGGLVGRNLYGMIMNCYATGNVIAGSDIAGGLVGASTGSTITNCYATGNVSVGTYMAGGLVGASYGSTIMNCYATGNVIAGSGTAGGLVGASNGSTITNCYATGKVTGDILTGGLVGSAIDKTMITNCYATGNVTGSGSDESYVGGLVGNNNDSVVSGSYWDIETSGQLTSKGGVGKTSAEMRLKETYVDWDFVGVWDHEPNQLPTLRNVEVIPTIEVGSGFYVVDLDTNTKTKLVTTEKNGYWQVADYGMFIIVTDGTNCYSLDMLTRTAKQTRRIGSVCARDARLVYGDVDGALNGVGWSALLGDDVTAILANTDPDIETILLNESGFMIMPWQGRIRAIRKLADHYIIYGDDGIAALREIEGQLIYAETNAPAGLGIYSRAAVDGSLAQHVFRGSDGGLWAIGNDLNVVKLDMGWALTDQSIIVYDPIENLFWIGGGSETFLLAKHGLTGPIDQEITSIITGTDITTGTDYPDILDIELLTNTLFVGHNGQKRVSVVNVNGEFTNARVGAKYKYASNDEYRDREPVRCSPEGAGFLNTVFVYGQILFLATMEPDQQIAKVEVRYQSHDRRFIRGTRGVVNADEEDHA